MGGRYVKRFLWVVTKLNPTRGKKGKERKKE